jgi:hypothetical protein
MERWQEVADELTELHTKHPDDVRRVLSTLPFEAETTVLVWNAVAETLGVLLHEVTEHNINGLSFGTEFQRMYAADSCPMHCVRWLAEAVGPLLGDNSTLLSALYRRFAGTGVSACDARKYRTLVLSKPAINNSPGRGDDLRNRVGRWGIFGPATTTNRASFQDIRCLTGLLFDEEPSEVLNFLELRNLPPISFDRLVERVRAIFAWIRQDLSYNRALLWLSENYQPVEYDGMYDTLMGPLATVIRVLYAAGVCMARERLPYRHGTLTLSDGVDLLRLGLNHRFRLMRRVLGFWNRIRDLVRMRPIAFYWFEAAQKKACCPLGPARQHHDARNRGDEDAAATARDVLRAQYLDQLIGRRLGGRAYLHELHQQAATLADQRIASLQ